MSTHAIETLAYVEKTIDNAAGLAPNLSWENREVVAMLADIRSLLITGSVVPGIFEVGR
ncbi:hypothetical protein [Microbacterium sp. NPDC087665]|uniref:hypothetical protein n=1 Tax=Microbacterium sp. NPDC087665 TaxID=3364194 RepID=UPI0038139988